MMHATRFSWAAGLLAAALAGPATGPRAVGDEPKGSPIRIGLSDSLFRDDPADEADKRTRPFQELLKAQTGLNGQVFRGIKPDDLGQQLKDGKLQLAIFQGYEYAWARPKDADLKPLMIAVNRQQHLRALILVRDDNGKNLGDLKGKTLAVPRRTSGHCQLFLERRSAAAGSTPKEFFGKVTVPANMEAAVDAVVNGHVDAVLIDGVFLDWYQERKPARFARLKTVAKSEVFPATVVAYRAGGLDDATLRRLRAGMVAAKDNPRGVELMTLCQMTSFEPVPEDYDKLLTEIAKAYPAPERSKGKK